MNKFMQFATGAKSTAWEIAQAVAADIVSRGHQAEARKGPAGASPDDEPTVNCAHVQTTEEGFAAYHHGRAERMAARGK